MTPLLEEYGLLFNKHWKLMICHSCQEGLPLHCIPEHLLASILPRWDNSKYKMANTTTNHIVVPVWKLPLLLQKNSINHLKNLLIIMWSSLFSSILALKLGLGNSIAPLCTLNCLNALWQEKDPHQNLIQDWQRPISFSLGKIWKLWVKVIIQSTIWP